jgi:methyl-galactoside transport system substrate-binding protein
MLLDCSAKSEKIIIHDGGPVRVSVFLYDFSDNFISQIGKSLEEVQKSNPEEVQYTFYDSKSNETIQNANINKVLSEGTDLILLNIVDIADAENVINKIKTTNIPLILFNREPITPMPIQSYSKALFIGTDPKQAGALQGKMLIDVWNNSKEYFDKNNNDRMQYIMLQGESNNPEAIGRTKYSVLTIDEAGIQTEQIAIEVCNWREDLAYNSTRNLFLKNGNRIEGVIANNDSMAIGAIKALQEFGYNKGDKYMTIPVVGIDLTAEARDFIEKGYMLGSVPQNPRDYADALYVCGMNLVHNKPPTEGTGYVLDDTGVAIRLPITEYFYKNIFLN